MARTTNDTAIKNTTREEVETMFYYTDKKNLKKDLQTFVYRCEGQTLEIYSKPNPVTGEIVIVGYETIDFYGNSLQKLFITDEIMPMYKALPPSHYNFEPTIYDYETCEHCNCRTLKGTHSQNSNRQYSPFARGSKLRELDGEMICPECANEMGYVECDDCGELIARDEAIETVDGCFFCDDECARNCGYEYCEHCGEYELACNGIEICTPTDYCFFCCEDCANSDGYYRCDDCGEWSDDYEHTESGRCICYSCYEENYNSCTECGCIYHNSEMYFSSYGAYCPNCSPCDCIHEYGYKPDYEYFGNESVHMGVELEIDDGDYREDCAQYLNDSSDGYIYLKEDGSIPNGIEIVSMPATLNAHVNTFKWGQWTQFARETGFLSDMASSSCGLHVHINRAFFSRRGITRTDAQARVFALVNYHKIELVNFARRNSTWSKYATVDELINFEQSLDDYSTLDTFFNEQNKDRYRAVNLCNSNTIELRMFKGSLNIETLYATFALVDGLARLACHYSVDGCIAMSWANIRDFVASTCHNETAKEAFKSYCIRRNL